MLATSALAMWYMEHSRLRDAYIDERSAQLDKTLQTQRLRLNQQIDLLRRDVLFLSNTPPITGIMRAAQNRGIDPRDGNTRETWEARLRDICSAFSQARPDYYRIRYIAAADGGREIVSVDSRGGKIVSARPDPGLRHGSSDFFNRVLELPTGDVLLSEFEYLQGTDQGERIRTLRAATPVRDPSGKVFGALVINLDVRDLLESSREGMPPDVETYVADMAGQYLLHPDAVRGLGMPGGAGITADFPVLTQMFQPGADDERPVQAMRLSRNNQLFAAIRLHFDPASPGRFLVLMHRIPNVLAQQRLFSLPTAHLAAGLAGILLAGWLALGWLRRSFAPLEQLVLSAERIAAGGQDVVLPKQGIAEIGRLTKAIRVMFGELSRREQDMLRVNLELEDRVSQRTSDLSFSNELLQAAVDEGNRRSQEVQAQLRRNQALMATSMDGIHVMDMQGNLVEANDAFCRMLGYSREEVLGMNVADWDAQWSGDELHERFLALIGKSALFETVHRRKDGALIDVEISSSGVEIDGQAFLFASSRDITERKRAEQALTDSERKFHALYDSMTEGVALHEIVLDASGEPVDYVLLDVNSAYEAITGLSRDEVIGRRASEVYGTGSAPYLERYAAVALTGNPDRFDTEFEPMERAFSISVFSPVGHQFATVFEDITERKTAEEALRRYQQVVETSADGFWVTDMRGNLLEANQAYADMSGYTVGELTRMHISQLEAVERPEDVRQHIEKIQSQGHDRFETRHRRKDGREIDIEISVTLMPEKQWLFVFCRDITRRKRDEQALQIAAVAFETQDAIMITDADANIVRVNRSFERITGYKAAEVLGKNPRIMSSGRHDREFYREMWRILKEQGAWSGEIWDRRKNGQVYPRWVTITVVRNDRNEITHYVGVFSDITERKRAEEEIRSLAFYDALTALPNRRLLMERMRAALAASARRRTCGALLFLDMDKFKTLNDTLGHDYGDQMLIEVAKRLKSNVREMDTVARLGGDEFVVLAEDVGGDEQDTMRKVGTVAEKIREALARPYRLFDQEYSSSPSIGVALYCGNGESVDDLLKRADIAMYQVKKGGRNAVCFFDASMQNGSGSRDALLDDLGHALERGELRLHYQPQVDGGRLTTGAEALLRWMHPQRGTVMPDDFIPVAEKGVLILDIDRWVLNEACLQLARWAGEERTRRLTLAVNISARYFTQPGFVDEMTALLASHRIDPGLLVVEVNERMVLDDLSAALGKMQALKAMGVSLSMDDFGNGYSSLTYLKQMPLDQVKICRSFVQGIGRDDNDTQLVQSIMDLGGRFGMVVLAEGVETEAQFEFLERHGCRAFQGFLFGKAIPPEEFVASLA